MDDQEQLNETAGKRPVTVAGVVADVLIGAVQGVVSFAGSAILLCFIVWRIFAGIIPLSGEALSYCALTTILVGSAVVSVLFYRQLGRVSRAQSVSFAVCALVTALLVLFWGLVLIGSARITPD